MPQILRHVEIAFYVILPETFLFKDVNMEGIIYPASIIFLVILAFVFYQGRNNMLMFIAIVIGIYIVYSQETGHTATEFKNDVVNSIDSEAKEFDKTHSNKSFDVEDTYN